MSELTRKLILHKSRQIVPTLIVAAAALLALTGIAGATPIPGSGLLTFNASNLSVSVTGLCLNFFNGSVDACPPGSPANFSINQPTDAVFGPTGTVGTTKDYLSSDQSSFSPGVQTYNNGTAFMQLNGFTFDILSINVPNAVPCPPGTTPGVCTIQDVVLTQQDLLTPGGPGTPCPTGAAACGHVSVAFSSNGRGYVTGSNPVATGSTPFTFNYSSQFENETISDILAKAAQGAVVASVSLGGQGLNTAAVPEPMTYSLMGLGLALIGGVGLRRRKAGRA